MDSWVLVTDAQSRAALAFIRSLGRRGIRIAAADVDRVAIGFFSRYCRRRLHYADPALHPDAYAHTIVAELARHRYDIVIPLHEGALFPLSERRHQVEPLTRFPFVSHERLLAGHDKARSTAIARECGLSTPDTFPINGPADIECALAHLNVPVIARPRCTSGSNGLHLVQDSKTLAQVCESIAHRFGPVIVQEYIPWGGFTYDVDVLMNRDSIPRALVVCKRIRTFPPLAGPTSCGQAVQWPDLAEKAVTFLQRMQWTGPAEVEFRVDPRNGEPVFMEMNPRFWGSLYTGIVAGVDFPYLFYRMVMDGDIPPVTRYRTDTKARYLCTLDLLCMATHPKKRTIARAWFFDFLDPHTRLFIPSWRDPVPLLGKVLASLTYGIRPERLARRLKRGTRRLAAKGKP